MVRDRLKIFAPEFGQIRSEIRLKLVEFTPFERIEFVQIRSRGRIEVEFDRIRKFCRANLGRIWPNYCDLRSELNCDVDELESEFDRIEL